MTRTRPLERALAEAIRTLDACRDDRALLDATDRAAERLAKTLEARGRILVCGNGGSMSDAMHFAEELTGRFRNARVPLPAMAFSDPATLSCIANDFGWEEVFARQVEAHGRPGDALVVLSTSGRSPNVLRALEAARDRGLTAIALLGRARSTDPHAIDAARTGADVAVVVPDATGTERIQEIHLLLLHSLVESIEERLGLSEPPAKRG